MQNFAKIGFGNDITKLAGYAHTATGSIGPVAIMIENVGASAGNTLLGDAVASQAGSTATITIKTFTATGVNATSGATEGTWSELVAPFTVAAGAKKIVQAVVYTGRIGFFGSGNTVVTVEMPVSHAAALRGGHIDIEPVGRSGWGFDSGIDREQMFPTPPAMP